MQDLTYKNYIFDFYGTLVDILTDEEDLAIWQQLTSLYAAYGADYTPYGLRQKYLPKFHKNQRYNSCMLSLA